MVTTSSLTLDTNVIPLQLLPSVAIHVRLTRFQKTISYDVNGEETLTDVRQLSPASVFAFTVRDFRSQPITSSYLYIHAKLMGVFSDPQVCDRLAEETFLTARYHTNLGLPGMLIETDAQMVSTRTIFHAQISLDNLASSQHSPITGDDNENHDPILEISPFDGNNSESGQLGNCAICLDDLSDDNVLAEMPCRHIFHLHCISTWLQGHNTCPLCRRVC